MSNKLNKIKQLITKLNKASDEYYNNKPQSMTDKEWDLGFDELTKLESRTGIIYSSSPTQNAGYPVMDGLDKIKHSTPLLSLGKTKSIDKLLEFLGDRKGVLMHKRDGSTSIIDYERNINYIATRGSSSTNEGQDITHNAISILGLPSILQRLKHIQIVGESTMLLSKFEEINLPLPEDEKYMNARNLANASVSMHDSKRVADREIRFSAFGILECDGEFETKLQELEYLKLLGFDVIEYILVDKNNIKQEVERMTSERPNLNFDIDGLVLAHNDLEYGRSLGKTERVFNNAIAFKFETDEEETILRSITKDIGKSSQLSYTANFDMVLLNGTEVSNATLHNYEYIKSLEIGIGDRIVVTKGGEIIPAVIDNLTRSGTYAKVLECPVCGSTLIHKTFSKGNKSVHQFCDNYGCERQIVGRLVHWCSRDAMNIAGVSEETIKAIRTIKIGLADRDKIILNEITDLYELEGFREELLKLPRFGKRKVDKLLQAIENSKTMPLNNVLYGLSIPQVGRTASKKIANFYSTMDNIFFEDSLQGTSKQTLSNLVGDSVSDSIIKNLLNNDSLINQIDILEIQGLTMTQPQEIKSNNSNKLEGLTFVVTGSINHFKNRKELEAKIESLGGINGKSVTSKTSYLINNDSESQSSKNVKANNLGVEIITEEQFLEMIK